MPSPGAAACLGAWVRFFSPQLDIMLPMKRRDIYLEDIPLSEAQDRFWAALEREGALGPTASQTVPLEEALGRVTAAPVWARRCVPHYHCAAMDGVAVRAEDTRGASETSPVRLTLGTQAIWVDTGDALPSGMNAVIMVEQVQVLSDTEIEIMAPVPPWQHVRLMGEDIVATELVLPAGQVLGPVEVGAAAAAGATQIEVRRKPRVAILPTGSELVPPESEPGPGQIVEFNSLMLAGQVVQWGGQPVRFPITPDDYATIKARVSEALDQCDVVVINAGSSAGSEDFTSSVVRELGQVVVHGVAIRPGHPVVLGLARGKPILGIPGYPVSAVLTSELFLRPIVYRLLNQLPPSRPTLKATITRKILSPMGEDEFLRVKLGRVKERMVATPLQRGAGTVMSLVRADGIVRIPRFSEGLHASTEVDVELLRAPEQVEQTIVAIGSHDLALDLLSHLLSARYPGMGLSSSNVGSLGGLIALKRGECHLAGSHLLDEESGEYNLPYVRRLLPGQRMVIMNLVYREQGLIVAPGNPKGISSLEDLLREDVVFVNRQKGAGTRVLLDYRLKQMGLDPGRIQGYEREEYTHLAVAAAVASGAADVGLGVLAAARALGLEFIPLLKERYDLVIPREFYDSPLLGPLLEIIRSEVFRTEVGRLGGYDTADSGKVMAET